MKVFVAALFAVLITGCANLQPTAVNPALTDQVNNVKSLIAAQAGDCSVPLAATTTADCANLDRTVTTVDQNLSSVGACITDAGGVKLGAQIAGVKAAICAKPAVPAVVAAPAVAK